MLYRLIIFVFGFIVSITPFQCVYAQADARLITGKVSHSDGRPAVGATISIAGTSQKVEADGSGHFSLRVSGSRIYSLAVTHVGTTPKTVEVDLSVMARAWVEIILETQTNTLKEAAVTAKSATQRVRDQTIKAEVVDTKAAQTQSATLVELMNRSAGIRIRQSGGLGSSTNIMLNGFQGRSIKTFKDGIPTDYLGAAFNFATIPVNMLERVEVYKGVLPAALGADALGGAVNLVSRMDGHRYLALSYEAASFNTHRASVNLYHSNGRYGFFTGLDAFYNHSDNSYTVTADVPDPETANVIPTDVKLFHNAYQQWYAEGYAGWKGLSWADEIRVGITAFGINRDNQFAALMERPFGAASSEQHASAIPTIRYQKSFLDGRLTVDQFAVYSRIRSKQIDTLSGSYDWFGIFHPPADAGSRGEAASPTLATLTFSNLTSRTGATYALNDRHRLVFNLVFNDYNRNGRDPYGPVSAGTNPVDLQSLPADYTKTVATFGLQSRFWQNLLENVAQIKYYGAQAVGQEVNTSTGLLKEQTSSGNTSTVGLADAVKINLTDRTFFRLSAEWATRLPEQSEILGNGAYALSNFSIKPERSVNGNIGFGTSKPSLFSVEVNSFYRITKDLILSVPVNLIYSRSLNVEQVRGIGLETDVHVTPLRWLRLNGNFTYQDFRLYHVTEPTIRYLEKARLRNIPYFFANLGSSVQFDRLLGPADRLHAYWYASYVHTYYLDYIPKDTEPDGFLGLWGEAKVNAPNIIPGQFIQTAGVVWHPVSNTPLSVNLECKNLFDRAVYDNFRIQNAGRSFHVKLNYTLHYH